MSANGEIEIAVTAEGADDAAQELADDGGGGDGPPTGGGGGLSGNLRAGAIAGIVLSLLGPLLNVLDPMLKILQAFLAPVASLLLRLLSPVLRWLVRLLPGWMSFIDNLPGYVQAAVEWLQSLPGRIWNFIMDLPGMIWGAIKDGASWITDGAAAFAKGVWNGIKNWGSKVLSLLQDIVEGVGGTIDTGAAILDPRQPFRISEIPFDTPFTGTAPDDSNPLGLPETESMPTGQTTVDVQFDSPEWLKMQERDPRTDSP